MASKAYTITMPEEMMAIVDEMARREHRSRSEMLREMVRLTAADRLTQHGDVLGALAVLLEPLKQATDKMSDEEFDRTLAESIREVRDAKGRARHERRTARSAQAKRSQRAPMGAQS